MPLGTAAVGMAGVGLLGTEPKPGIGAVVDGIWLGRLEPPSPSEA